VAGFGGARRRSAADEALIRSLYDEHGRAVWAYANRLLHDGRAADDVLQQVLVGAWRTPQVLANGKGWVRGWLLGVARELANDRLRATGQPAVEPAHPASVLDPKAVLAALDQLTKEHRDVLVEIYLNGSSVARAAQRLGIPPETVRARSYHALHALRHDVVAAPVLEGASR
jgi:RNA polymerase sigma-70 factor, ECF subfamily